MSIGLTEQHQFEQSMKKLLANIWIGARFIILLLGWFQLAQFIAFLFYIAPRS